MTKDVTKERSQNCIDMGSALISARPIATREIGLTTKCKDKVYSKCKEERCMKVYSNTMNSSKERIYGPMEIDTKAAVTKDSCMDKGC